MMVVFGLTVVSADGGGVLGWQPIPTDNSGLYSPPCVDLQFRRKDRNCAWCMAGTICLAATIFLLLRGHQCLRLLESLSKLAGAAKGRLLSVTETGDFRKCVESGGDGELGATGGAEGEASGSASHSSSTASSAGASNEDSNDYSGGASSGAVGGSDHAPGPAMHEQEDFESSVGGTARGLSNPNSSRSNATTYDPLGSAGANGRNVFSAEGRQKDANEQFDMGPPPSRSAELDSLSDREEHARQLQLLQPPPDVRKKLTKQEIELLSKAEEQLRELLDKRASLLSSLRKNEDLQSRIQKHLNKAMLQSYNVYKQERRRLQGNLDELQRQAFQLERKLCKTLDDLKSLVPYEQHMALSLRISAACLANKRRIPSRGADAVSAAILIVRGSTAHYLLTCPVEEDAILEMCNELWVRMQKSTESLKKKLRTPVPVPASGFASQLSHRKRQSIERQKQKCESLLKEASTFITQLRLVSMRSPPTEKINALEIAIADLRQTMDHCSTLLGSGSFPDHPSPLRSLFRRLRLRDV